MKEIIRKIEIFTGLDDKVLSKVADTAITCTYSPDEIVIREGERGIGMYFILRGRVAAVRNKPGGEVRLAEMGPGEFFAEMALIDEKPRSASIVTVEETECLLFTRDTFLRLVEKHPSLSLKLARVLAERLRTLIERPGSMPAEGQAAAPAPGAPAGNAATPQETGLKAEVQKKLIGMFEQLYTAKALTRFSVAILGCPVEGSGADALEVIRLGDVKAVFLPAEGPAELAIDAWGEGQFQLHVFHPGLFADGPPKALRFEPVPIQPRDRFTLSLPDAVLTRHARTGGRL